MNPVLCPKCHKPQDTSVSPNSQAVVMADVTLQARKAMQHIAGYAIAGSSIGRQSRITQPLAGSTIGGLIGGLVGIFTCDVPWPLIRRGISDGLLIHYQCSHCGHHFKRFDI